MTERESLEDRVADLEASIDRIEKLVKAMANRLTMVSGGRADPRTTARPPAEELRGASERVGGKAEDRQQTARPRFSFATRARDRSRRPVRDSQWWLSRIGIALLLFGVLYLFKYAVDQGWLSPLIRVLMGIGLGAGLTTLGVRLHASRGWYARALLVGGIITHFITMYAAFQWYDLVSQATAMLLLAFVSLAALALAVRLDDVSVAVTGAAGALINPVLLADQHGSIPMLMAYLTGTLTILSGVFLLKGWKTFVWVTFYVTWSVLLLTANAAFDDGTLTSLVWTSVGIAAGIIALWFVPLLRERLIRLDPEKWKRPAESSEDDNFDRHAHVLSVLTPLVALLAIAVAWDLSRPEAGWVALAISALGLVVFAVVSRWRAGNRLAFSQAVTVVSLVTLALALILDGNALLVALAVEAAALHLIGLRMQDDIPLRAGQAMLAGVALWVLARLLTQNALVPAVLNRDALVDGLSIGIVLFLGTKLRNEDEAAGYKVGAHIMILAWLARELSSLPNGSGLVTLAWGAYGTALLIYGLMRRRSSMRQVAMATLLLVVAKLFLVDLALLAPIWRIMLFMGFGGLFLILSYYFQDLWKPEPDAEDDATA